MPYLIKRGMVFCLFLLFVSSWCFVGMTNNEVSEDVLIKFQKGADTEQIDSLIKELGLEKVKSFEEINVDVFHISSNLSVNEVVKLCSNVSFIEYAEPSGRVRALAKTEQTTEPVEEPPLAVQAESAEYKEGEIIIKYKSEISIQSARQSLSQAGIEVVTRIEEIQALKCQILNKKSVMQAVAECNADPNVLYAEPNYIYRASVIPNDDRFSSLYGMKMIQAPEAWDIHTGDKSVIVGVIDTGVDTDHEDLKANIWFNPGESGDGKENNKVDDDGNGFVDDYRGWDFINNDNNPYDDNNHGTHCSGSIGAIGNNSKGVVGVCWNVSIMPLKFLAANGSGTTDDAVDAILYATKMGAKILSNSWGGGGKSKALEDAIKYANDNGVLFVAAAGNEYSNNDKAPSYPASYEVPNVISVAANTSSDNLAGFSNYGKTTVDLAAPGNNILSTVARSRYESLSGTSMATPHVSGAAALIWSKYPGLTLNQLIVRLLGSVDRKSAYADKVATGGRLNVYKAVSGNPIIARTTQLENTLDEAGPYVVECDVIADAAIQEVTLTYQVTGQDAVTVNMTSAVNNHYKGEIPGQALGSTIVYYVTATDADGKSTKDSNFTFSIAEPTGGGCCGQPAISLDLQNDTVERPMSALFNIGFFLLPFIIFKLSSRRKRK